MRQKPLLAVLAGFATAMPLATSAERISPRPVPVGTVPGAIRPCPRFWKAGLLAALLCFVWHAPAAGEPNWFNYQIQFPPPPSQGSEALSSLDARADAVTTFMACGAELRFFNSVLVEHDPSNDQGNGEDITAIIIGKMAWLNRNGPVAPNCEFTTDFHHDDVANDDEWSDFLSFLHPGGNSGATNKKMADVYGPDCGTSIIHSVFIQDDPDPAKITASVHFTVSPQCMRTQVNLALLQMSEGDKQLGSSGLPCNGNPFHTTKGEWDVTVRNLTRIVYLDRANDAAPILNEATRSHVEEELISVDGPPGQPSYSWLQCGDTERSTGSDEDRADENSWVDDALGTTGDILKWLLRRFLLILLVFTVLGLLGALAASLGAIDPGLILPIAGLLAAIPVLAFDVRIPETENHRFMIETSRFLKNERIIARVRANHTKDLAEDQAELKEFLMQRFKEVLSDDFSEYNARPYQRYSLEALLNVADFARDQDVKLGASMALQYALAKFAVSSSENRRFVPFRRLMGEVKCSMESCIRDNDPPTPGPTEELEQGRGADHLTALGLIYTGQTQELLAGRVSGSSAADMVYAASFATNPTAFKPDPLILDLAIRKDVPYLQKLHHHGFEIYSGSRSTLITAGGIETDPANPVLLGPFAIGGRKLDTGAGVPTTIMFTRLQPISAGTFSRMVAPAYIRFEGGVKHYTDQVESFQDNLCVWKNFACGTNLRIPDEFNKCLEPIFPGVHPNWYTLDSTSCEASKPFQPFFLVVFRICQDQVCTPDHLNAGFIEVVDNPADSLPELIEKLKRDNRTFQITSVCLVSHDCRGHYHALSGYDLEIDLFGHENDSRRTGIESIDGLREPDIGDWQFAEGAIISAAGDGLVVIKNPRLQSSLRLDLRDISKPSQQ